MAWESFAVGYNGNNKILKKLSDGITKLAKDVRHKWTQISSSTPYVSTNYYEGGELFSKYADRATLKEILHGSGEYPYADSNAVTCRSMEYYEQTPEKEYQNMLQVYRITVDPTVPHTTYYGPGLNGEVFPAVRYKISGLYPNCPYTIYLNDVTYQREDNYLSKDVSRYFGLLLATSDLNECPILEKPPNQAGVFQDSWFEALQGNISFLQEYDIKLHPYNNKSAYSDDHLLRGMYGIKGKFYSFPRMAEWSVGGEEFTAYSDNNGCIYAQFLYQASENIASKLTIGDFRVKEPILKNSKFFIDELFSAFPADPYAFYGMSWLKYKKDKYEIYEGETDPDTFGGSEGDFYLKYRRKADNSINVVDHGESGFPITINSITEEEGKYTVNFTINDPGSGKDDQQFVKLRIENIDVLSVYHFKAKCMTPSLGDPVVQKGGGNYIQINEISPSRFFYAFDYGNDDYEPYTMTVNREFVSDKNYVDLMLMVPDFAVHASGVPLNLSFTFYMETKEVSDVFIRKDDQWIYLLSNVTANPQDEPTGQLSTIKIGSSVYSIGGANRMSQLTDVYLDGLRHGQVLKWNNVENKWINESESGGSLSGLSDTSIVSPSDSQVLRYNFNLQKWQNQNDRRYIGDLENVSIEDPQEGQVLKYDSAAEKWINGTGGGGSSDLEAIDLNQSQYNALTPAEKADLNKMYFITDGNGDGSIVGWTISALAYSQLTASQYQALSEAEKNNGTVYFISDNSTGAKGLKVIDITTAEYEALTPEQINNNIPYFVHD